MEKIATLGLYGMWKGLRHGSGRTIQPWREEVRGACRGLMKSLLIEEVRQEVYFRQVTIVTLQMDEMNELKDFCLLLMRLHTLVDEDTSQGR